LLCSAFNGRRDLCIAANVHDTVCELTLVIYGVPFFLGADGKHIDCPSISIRDGLQVFVYQDLTRNIRVCFPEYFQNPICVVPPYLYPECYGVGMYIDLSALYMSLRLADLASATAVPQHIGAEFGAAPFVSDGAGNNGRGRHPGHNRQWDSHHRAGRGGRNRNRDAIIAPRDPSHVGATGGTEGTHTAALEAARRDHTNSALSL
jgi:hypothetical protein